MKKRLLWSVGLFVTSGALCAIAQEMPAMPDPVASPPSAEPVRVLLSTSEGDIELALFPDRAPETVSNFVQYVEDGHYAGTVFHRVINGFMIQGGGFDEKLNQRPTRAAIKNEAANGLKNKRGTIAMARTPMVDSATSQFFINVVDNAFLDYRAPTPQGFGYCVFGEVTKGMDVVDAIKAVPTGNKKGMGDVPNEDIVIREARILETAPVEKESEPSSP